MQLQCTENMRQCDGLERETEADERYLQGGWPEFCEWDQVSHQLPLFGRLFPGKEDKSMWQLEFILSNPT